MLIQSFFIGDIRCGGMGTRLVSDFDVVEENEDLGRVGNDGVVEGVGADSGSTSIITSSSSLASSTLGSSTRDSRVMSSSALVACIVVSTAFPFLFSRLLRVFL